MTHRLRPTGSSISAFLRRQGWLPVPTRDREGLHVSEGLVSVHVSMQWDNHRTNREQAREVLDALRMAGYDAELAGEEAVRVHR